jgi:hypothetical protein
MNLRPILAAAGIAMTLGASAALAQSTTPTPAPAPAPAPAANPGYTPSWAIAPRTIRRQDGLIYATARSDSGQTQYARVASFGECASRVSPSLSARLLSTEPGSGGSAALSRQLRGISKGCLPAGAYVPTTFFRGAVAESMYRRSADASGRAPLAAPLATPARVETLSECLFALSPSAVDGLLRTRPGSASERKAFGHLATFAPRCITSGQRVSISGIAPLLRAELAEVAYRSVAPAQARTSL